RNPKHSMRLVFRRQYGDAKLRYPFFGEGATDEFDTIVLRSNSQDAWVYDSAGNRQGQFIRDHWARATQLEMGQPAPHGNWVHLYINGLYWGLYHVFERPNASFLASYLGGDKEEYDAFNVGSVVDGNLAAWNQMVGIANSGLASPEVYAEIQQFLDVPNMIDFLLINFYSANVDWDHRNWYGGRRRQAGAGFKFFCWDAERTFWNFDQNRANLNNAGRPTGIHQRLRANREYRVLFGDHVHRHLFNGGALTPRSAEERWMARAEEIESALSAEAARWGDNKRPSRPYTRDREWLQELRSLRRNFFPRRTGLLLGQLRAQQVYPTVAAPSFNRHGGAISPGFVVRLTAPSGTIHHVPDGSDPRLPGGALSPDARVFPAGGLFLEDSTRVTARVRAGNTWSALADATFVLDPSALRITEVMYNPPPSPDGFFGNDQFEFIELQNVGGEPLGVAGVRLAGGVDFAFPTDEIPEDLAPGAFVLVVRNLEAFASRYDTQGLRIAGEYTGALSNAGELIVLRDPVGEALLDFVYSDTWQPSTDGAGRSLVAADPGAPRAAWRGRAGWRASRREGGSPGREDHFGEGGLQRPGDINQDRVLDISDAISLLGHLFVASPAILPCEGTTDEEGNRRLLDSNGDGNVDLTDAITVLLYLFADGAPPALGTVCQPLPGCPEGCR
ncbi:MAG: CotH kinase family protein, partial [Planctomycetota bacterium]|nr:CotH kinase family protein [Planctomycetota bacterium]